MLNMRHAFGVLPLLVLHGAWAVGHVGAQEEPAVEIRGTVVDDAESTPLSGVSVVVLDSYGEALGRRTTSEGGEFSLRVRNRAGVRIRAGRLGYREVTTEFLPFGDGTLFVVEVRLATEAVPLAPLTVVARSGQRRSPVLTEFDRRAESGIGSYFTRRDIERIRPGLVSDLLARVPGVRLESSGGSNRRRTVTMSRSAAGPGGGPCPVQIFMDGRLLTRGGAGDIAIDDLVSPGSVNGIEIYRGLSTVPPEFLNPSSRCGVVAIWTRRGG